MGGGGGGASVDTQTDLGDFCRYLIFEGNVDIQ